MSSTAREVPIVDTVSAVSDTTADMVRVALVVKPSALSMIRIVSAVVSHAVWSTARAVHDPTAVVTRAFIKALRGERVAVHLIILSSCENFKLVICTPK